MRFNQKLQLGLLFALYLTRSGKTTAESAADGLGVSTSFMALVANALHRKGVIKSTRGRNGGYELNGDPLVGDIFKALSPVKLVCTNRQAGTSHEYRALYGLASALTQSMAPLMNRKVRNLVGELYANDTARLNRPSPSTQAN